jgi:predicted secreted protein
MAKENGRNVLLKVGDGATPTETFNTLEGQENTEITWDVSELDFTAKDTGDDGEYDPNRKRYSITCSGKATWGTTNTALETLLTASQTATKINCQAAVNAAGDAYEGSWIVSGGLSGQDAEATRYNFTLRNANTITNPTY